MSKETPTPARPALDAMAEEIERLKVERDNWMERARQFHCNEDYYRGLVVKIGEALGEPAYTQDDGGKVDSVLCAKVPELVEASLRSRLAQANEAQTRPYHKLYNPFGPTPPAQSAGEEEIARLKVSVEAARIAHGSAIRAAAAAEANLEKAREVLTVISTKGCAPSSQPPTQCPSCIAADYLRVTETQSAGEALDPAGTGDDGDQWERLCQTYPKTMRNGIAAARRSALEEAARRCLLIDRKDAIDCPNGDGWVWYGKSRDHCAKNIRSLTQDPARDV